MVRAYPAVIRTALHFSGSRVLKTAPKSRVFSHSFPLFKFGPVYILIIAMDRTGLGNDDLASQFREPSRNDVTTFWANATSLLQIILFHSTKPQEELSNSCREDHDHPTAIFPYQAYSLPM
jgi:hypothetical protein